MKLSENAKKVLPDLIEKLESVDNSFHEKQLRRVKLHLLYWEGKQDVAWSETSRDWVSPTTGKSLSDDKMSAQDDFGGLYGRSINIYKPHLESIIAALCVKFPSQKYFPVDANDVDDINTANAFSTLGEIIKVWNKGRLLMMKMFRILCNEDFVATYTYNDESFDYGKIKGDPIYGEEEVENTVEVCAQCGTPKTEFPVCMNCGGEEFVPEIETISEPYIEDYTYNPKGRQIIETYGPRNVKIPEFASKLSDCPYLILETEIHVVDAFKIWGVEFDDQNESAQSTLERHTNKASNRDIKQVKRAWLRPQNYEYMQKEKPAEMNEIREKYPLGACVVLVNKEVVDCYEAELDKEWSIIENPMFDTVHAQPVGATILVNQDIRNDLVDFTMQQIEFGIPETFADPRVVDFDKYEKSSSTIGSIRPAKAREGQSLDGSFVTLKTATLSKEINDVFQRNDADAQFQSGALPSIFGGQPTGGSQTLGEYQISRNMALQRLSINSEAMLNLIATTMEKAVRGYADYLLSKNQDETFVQEKAGSFISTVVSNSQLNGQVGNVLPETSDQFPVSHGEIRAYLMELIQTGNPEILAAVFHPENIGEVNNYIGFKTFHIPGESDRNKQLMEIAQLLKEEPEQGQPQLDPFGMPLIDPMTGQPIPPPLLSSVPIEPGIDNDMIQMETIRQFLLSNTGQWHKKNNMKGYQNVVLHYDEHEKNFQMTQMASQPPLPEGKDKPKPIGESSELPPLPPGTGV